MEKNREEVVPVMADVSPELERKLSTRHDYTQTEQAILNRRNSPTRGPPSRKPTASYGVDPTTGQPDPSALPERETPIEWAQLIHENENKARGSGAPFRGPPSRKPTASYGIDPINGNVDQGAGLLGTTGTSHQVTLSEQPRPSNASIATRDIRVPGDYPSDQ